jgi:hypothetical protein
VLASPVAAAGIVVGDVIVAIDGQACESARDFQRSIQGRTPGDMMEFTVAGVKGKRTVLVEVGALEAQQAEVRSLRHRAGVTTLVWDRMQRPQLALVDRLDATIADQGLALAAFAARAKHNTAVHALLRQRVDNVAARAAELCSVACSLADVCAEPARAAPEPRWQEETQALAAVLAEAERRAAASEHELAAERRQSGMRSAQAEAEARVAAAESAKDELARTLRALQEGQRELLAAHQRVGRERDAALERVRDQHAAAAAADERAARQLGAAQAELDTVSLKRREAQTERDALSAQVAALRAELRGASAEADRTVDQLQHERHAAVDRQRACEASVAAACAERLELAHARLADAHAEKRELARQLECARADAHGSQEAPLRLQAELEHAHGAARQAEVELRALTVRLHDAERQVCVRVCVRPCFCVLACFVWLCVRARACECMCARA